MRRIKGYWLFADVETDEEKAKRLAEEKRKKEEAEKLQKIIDDKVAEAIKTKADELEQKIKDRDEEIAKLKEENENKPSEHKKEVKGNKETHEPTETEKKILAELEYNRKIAFNNKKAEIMKKYGLKDEHFAECKKMEDLDGLDKIYELAFGMAKNKYTAEDEIAKVLKDKKKMITVLDNPIGEKEQKLEQDKKTKAIMNFFNSKK